MLIEPFHLWARWKQGRCSPPSLISQISHRFQFPTMSVLPVQKEGMDSPLPKLHQRLAGKCCRQEGIVGVLALERTLQLGGKQAQQLRLAPHAHFLLPTCQVDFLLLTFRYFAFFAALIESSGECLVINSDASKTSRCHPPQSPTFA